MNPELWAANPLLALLSFLPVPLGALWMGLAPALARRGGRRLEHGLAWLTWVATRPLFALLVVGLLGHRSVDLVAFFLPQAKAAAAGMLPYRDFASAHAPLFPFLLGLALRVAGEAGPLAVFLAGDLIAWRALAARDRVLGAGPLGGAGWAYLAFPPVWYLTVRYAQDEALSAAFAALALLAFERGRHGRAGLALAGGMLLTKPLFGLVVLPFVLAPGVRWRRALPAFLLPLALVYGVFLVLGAPVWEPFTLHRASFGVGPSLWRVPIVLWGFDLGAWGWAPFLIVVVGYGLLQRRTGWTLVEQAVWGYAGFAMLGPKFYPMYALMWAPLVAVWTAGGGVARRWWWALLGVLLPLSLYLDSGPLQGRFGTMAQVWAVLGLLALPLAHLYPQIAVWREGRRRFRAALDDRRGGS